MSYPTHRGRRLRRTEGLRRMVRETRLSPDQLVAPLFVHQAPRREAIPSLPGHARFTPEQAAEEAAALAALGVGSVLLFGIPDRKDDEGSSAWDSSSSTMRMWTRSLDTTRSGFFARPPAEQIL